MEPSEIGPYLLLGLGVAAVVSAIVGYFKELPIKHTGLMWVFGLALLGIGSYGPAFLADYVSFVQALNQVSGPTPDAEQVAEFLDRAERAGVSTHAREAILVDVLDRSVPDETRTQIEDPSAAQPSGDPGASDAGVAPPETLEPAPREPQPQESSLSEALKQVPLDDENRLVLENANARRLDRSKLRQTPKQEPERSQGGDG